jgi:hypothetical protein
MMAQGGLARGVGTIQCDQGGVVVNDQDEDRAAATKGRDEDGSLAQPIEAASTTEPTRAAPETESEPTDTALLNREERRRQRFKRGVRPPYDQRPWRR